MREVLDLDTLTQRQDRSWGALKERYQYKTSIRHGQDFLIKHVRPNCRLLSCL